MNILIRFEDRYGCKTLFEYSRSCLLDPSKCKLDIECSLGDAGVFNVSKRLVAMYDYVILVFDMDNQRDYSLTFELLMSRLNRNICKAGIIKNDYVEKIILVPIFFSFESLYLFSQRFRNRIAIIDNERECESKELIALYKTYYDYSVLNPENLDNIVNKLGEIQREVSKITGDVSKKRWLPQKFHLSYSKQLLKLMYTEVISTEEYGRLGDSLFEKHESALFSCFKQCASEFDVFEIIEGLSKDMKKNHWIYNILTLNDVTALTSFTLDKNIRLIEKDLDDYNKAIHGNHELASPKMLQVF